MSRRRRAEIGADYLPGFSDALSNVLLALLLVVGVIAMGLVSLNLNIMAQQVKMAEARAEQIILERRRAEALALAQGAGTGNSPTAPPPGAIAIPPGMAPGLPARGGGPTDVPGPGNSPFEQPGAGTSPYAAGVPRVIRLSRSSEDETKAAERAQAATAVLTGPIRADSVAQEVIGGAFVARLEFDLRETSWSAERILPAMNPVGGGAQRTLVTFADLGNRRQMAVAFGRLNSLREALVRTGVPAASLKLRILQTPTALENEPSAISSVYVIDGRQP
jgi:hypothetical protein